MQLVQSNAFIVQMRRRKFSHSSTASASKETGRECNSFAVVGPMCWHIVQQLVVSSLFGDGEADGKVVGNIVVVVVVVLVYNDNDLELVEGSVFMYEFGVSGCCCGSIFDIALWNGGDGFA